MAPDRRQSSGQRDRARARARSQRCLKCQLCEGRWRQGVPQHVRQSETVRVRRNPDEVRLGASTKISWFQTALAVLGEDDAVERSALEAALKKAQVQAVIPPVAERIEQTQKFIERARKRVLVAEEYVQWAQDWKVECEKELSEAEERLSRLRSEAERPMAAVPESVTEVQRLQQQLAEAQAQLHQQGSVSGTTAGPTKRPRRREDFMCSCAEEVIEWISDRQFDISRGDQEGQCGRGGQVVEPCGPSSDEFATSPHFYGGAICPNTRDFFRHRKLDDSVIGRSARTVAKYGHQGHRVGEASHSGPPKSLLRRRGPFAIAGMRNVVPRVERTQTSTVVDSDEEPLLPPPPGATQLEDVTDSLGAALGSDVVPRSRSDVDDEATPHHVDSTFLDHFERDLGVLPAIHDGVHPRVWGPIRVSGVCQRRCSGASRGGLQRKVRSVGRRGQR